MKKVMLGGSGAGHEDPHISLRRVKKKTTQGVRCVRTNAKSARHMCHRTPQNKPQEVSLRRRKGTSQQFHRVP